MKNSTKRKLAIGFALAGIGAGAYGEGQYENPNDTKPRTPQEISLSDTANPEILATFEYQSQRPEPEYNGKTFLYNILSNGDIVQADKPDAKFLPNWFYDLDNDGKFGDTEREAIKSGKLIYMHPQFNQIANEEIKNIFSNLISQRKGLTQTLESERQAWEAQKQEYENKLEEMSRQPSISDFEPRVPQKQFEERMNEYEKQEQAARIDDPILNPENIGKVQEPYQRKFGVAAGPRVGIPTDNPKDLSRGVEAGVIWKPLNWLRLKLMGIFEGTPDITYTDTGEPGIDDIYATSSIDYQGRTSRGVAFDVSAGGDVGKNKDLWLGGTLGVEAIQQNGTRITTLESHNADGSLRFAYAPQTKTIDEWEISPRVGIKTEFKNNFSLEAITSAHLEGNPFKIKKMSVVLTGSY